MPKKKHKHGQQRGLGQKERRFMHLKEFSLGKPNELSFNVLEQKVANLDEKPAGWRFWRRSKNKQIPDLSSDTMPLASTEEAASAPSSPAQTTSSVSASGSVDLTKPRQPSHQKREQSAPTSFLGASSQAEIEKRQHRRKQYRRASIAVVTLVCIVGVAVASYWYIQERERLSTSVGVLQEACDIIEKSDEVTVAIDEFFQTSFDDNTIDTANQLLDAIPSAREDLEEARSYAQRAEGELEGSQRDVEAAQHALSTIDARETLLDLAEERLNDDIVAKQAIDAVAQAQEAIEQGNTLLSQSAQIISDTTEENVDQSTEYSTSAQEQFEQASELITQAKEYYPSADWDALEEYVSEKIKAAEEAILSNEAILIQDKDTAESHNDAYNNADAAATTIAQDLPEDLTDIVVEAYSEYQESLISDYEDARTDAATHDAHLRDYLGTAG